MRLPTEKERMLLLKLAPWFDHASDKPAIRDDAPEEIKVDFKEWLALAKT